LDSYTAENKQRSIKIGVDAVSRLKKHIWPGNVRELKAVIELAAVMSDGEKITEQDVLFDEATQDAELLSNEMTLDEYTFRIIRHYLKKNDNNVLLVAQKLNVGKSTLYRYLKQMEELGI
jgi:DNA-binding NtrC family response regulator